MSSLKHSADAIARKTWAFPVIVVTARHAKVVITPSAMMRSARGNTSVAMAGVALMTVTLSPLLSSQTLLQVPFTVSENLPFFLIYHILFLHG